MKEVTWGKGMRLEVLSKIPTATATRKKTFQFFFWKIWQLKKVLIFAAAIEKKAKVLWKIYISTSSTSIIINTVNNLKINTNSEHRDINNLNNEEFDPGSGWTLATGLTHASRGAARCSNTLVATGARVSNAYATYLSEGNNPAKVGLIPHKTGVPHGNIC